jgi:hypothetical protein
MENKKKKVNLDYKGHKMKMRMVAIEGGEDFMILGVDWCQKYRGKFV